MYSLLLWFINGAALWVTAQTIKGIHINGFLTAMLAALVLAAANHILLPILTILTLPITVLTLGIFWLVLYGGMLKLSAAIIPGFAVDGWLPAIIGAIFLAVVQGVFRFGFMAIVGPWKN
jgi:putative membrane protein